MSPKLDMTKKYVFGPRTSASVIKLRNILGKIQKIGEIQKITEKGFTGEILQGFYFDPQFLTGSARYANLQTFF